MTKIVVEHNCDTKNIQVEGGGVQMPHVRFVTTGTVLLNPCPGPGSSLLNLLGPDHSLESCVVQDIALSRTFVPM